MEIRHRVPSLERLFALLVGESGWLSSNAWAITAGTLLAAGGYQFTPLKQRCLRRCRSPLSVLASNWHGRNPQSDAFRLGLHHGAFCLGCCWLLMLLMFAVGVGSPGWMLALAAVIAVEKNSRWGARMSGPLGVALLTASLALAGASVR